MRTTRLHNANDKPSWRIGRYDGLIGIDEDAIVGLNERFLTRGGAYRIMEELSDLLGARENGFRIVVKLSNRRTVSRMGTAKRMLGPVDFIGNSEGKGVNVYRRSTEIVITLYRWTELILLHELAHAKNWIDGKWSGHGGDFRDAMRELVERRLATIRGERLPVATGKRRDKRTAVLGLLARPGVWTAQRIAMEVGSTKRSVQSMVCRLRKAGHDIRLEYGEYNLHAG